MMQAIKDWVLIEPEKLVQAKGILIPDSLQEDSGYGTVISAGEKAEVNPGDRVVWDRLYGAGFRFDLDGREVIALHNDDIFGSL
jgi:co-chaperonin GroES (HSP10)